MDRKDNASKLTKTSYNIRKDVFIYLKFVEKGGNSQLGKKNLGEKY
jgi:hypothetical protein